ncbi:MAG: hypothetical protein ACRCYV_04140 [Aeromonas sp.]
MATRPDIPPSSGALSTSLRHYGAAEGSPSHYPQHHHLWAALQEPPSSGRQAQISIYASGSTRIAIRPRRSIQPGHLLRSAHAWYLIEDSYMIRGQQILSCRKLAGEPANYQPKRGDAYPITAFLVSELALVGAMNESRQQIDLIQAELAHPYARQGDIIALRGRRYQIDGWVEGSDNGTTLRVIARELT